MVVFLRLLSVLFQFHSLKSIKKVNWCLSYKCIKYVICNEINQFKGSNIFNIPVLQHCQVQLPPPFSLTTLQEISTRDVLIYHSNAEHMSPAVYNKHAFCS